MRIVHTEASCGWGGQEIRILEESKGMIERGHEVLLLCPPESGIHTEAVRWGVAVEALPIGRKKLQGVLALRHWLQTHRIDILNTHSSTDSWLTALACASLSQSPPLVRTRHISAPIPDNGPTRWLYTRATHHIVTTGEALRRELIERNRYPASMITSVPTGIDPARFYAGDKPRVRQLLGLDTDGHYLGIVATLRSWKGHLYLLDAFSRIEAPDWKLLIVGDGPMREALQKRADELGMQGRAIFVGQQTEPEKWLRALDIFCLPSYANEGVPQALIQAMMTELPIVTTPVGAIGELISDGSTGLIVTPKSAEALATAISKLMRDTATAAALGQRARAAAVASYSREAMLDHMTRIFESVLAGSQTA